MKTSFADDAPDNDNWFESAPRPHGYGDGPSAHTVSGEANPDRATTNQASLQVDQNPVSDPVVNDLLGRDEESAPPVNRVTSNPKAL